MISLSCPGSYKTTTSWLKNLSSGDIYSDLSRYAQLGVEALARATPTETGRTANAWGYKIVSRRNSTSIQWVNNNINDGANIAILLQYGHGTGTGGYVQGYDYINPAIRPIFDQIADDVWKKVTRG